MHTLFYGHSLAFTAILVIGLCIGTSLLGQWVVQRLVSFNQRKGHNDVMGYAAATGGLIYVVLLAFIASTVWVAYDRADSMVNQEASLAGDLFADASMLPKAFSEPAAYALRDYLRSVVTEEWPGMASGKPAAGQGWRLLREFYTDLSRVETVSPVQNAIVQEILTRLNHLYDVRRERIRIASRPSLNPVIWLVVLLGGLLTLAFGWFLGFQKNALHYASNAMIATILGLVIFLIVAFNFPFRGRMQISPAAFETLLKYIDKRVEKLGAETKPSGT